MRKLIALSLAAGPLAIAALAVAPARAADMVTPQAQMPPPGYYGPPPVAENYPPPPPPAVYGYPPPPAVVYGYPPPPLLPPARYVYPNPYYGYGPTASGRDFPVIAYGYGSSYGYGPSYAYGSGYGPGYAYGYGYGYWRPSALVRPVAKLGLTPWQARVFQLSARSFPLKRRMRRI